MKNLLDWLEFNKEILTTYSLDEIQDLAIAAGHDRSAVAQWFTHERFKRAA